MSMDSNMDYGIMEPAMMVKEVARPHMKRVYRNIAIVLVGKCVGLTSDNYQIVGIDCFYAVPKAVL